MYQSNRVYVLDVMPLNENKLLFIVWRDYVSPKYPAGTINRIVEEGAQDTDYMYL